jgi:isopenicillin N synthase-like dioxygenase
VLQQPGTSGLQVWYPPTQTWIPVPAKEDTFVFNIGDLLQKWTGGHYRSSVHRVLNIGDSHRYSAPFFYNGNVNVKFAPLDGAPPMTVEEHIRKRLVESLQPRKEEVKEDVAAHAGIPAAAAASVVPVPAAA